MKETPFIYFSNNLDRAKFVGPDDLVEKFKENFKKVLQKMDAYFLEHDYYSVVDYYAVIDQILYSNGYYRFCADDTLKKVHGYGRCYRPSMNGSYIVLYKQVLDNPEYCETVICHEFIHMLTICMKQKLVFKKGEQKKIITKFLPSGKDISSEIYNLTKHTYKRDNSKNPLYSILITEGFDELLCNKIYPDAPHTYFEYRKLVHLLNSLTGEENNFQDFLRGEFGDLESIFGKEEFLKIVKKSEAFNPLVLGSDYNRLTEQKEFSDIQFAIVDSAFKGIQKNKKHFNAKIILNFCGSLGVNASEMLNGFGARTYTINSVKEMLDQLTELKTENNEQDAVKFKELLAYSLYRANKLANCRYLSLFQAHELSYEKNVALENLALPNTTNGETYRKNLAKTESKMSGILDEFTTLLDNFEVFPYLKIVAKNCGLENVNSIKLLKINREKHFLLLDVDGYEPIYFPINSNGKSVYTESITSIQKPAPLYNTKLEENGKSEVFFNTGKMVEKGSSLITFTDDTRLVKFVDEKNNTRFGIPALPTSKTDTSKIVEISSDTIFSKHNIDLQNLILNDDCENVDEILDRYIRALLTPIETTSEILDANERLLKNGERRRVSNNYQSKNSSFDQK